ncbi:unnamed protein product [Diatraea saccharalis]|uniref:acid phosphatase n=1 Tax=Diatraea saccharalis TaxID=40085 RepID=A0A9N9N1D3_9NEOP|nr:unnamed protein product [Diatraea saccharalis]
MKLVCLVFLITAVFAAPKDPELKDTELIFTFLVHRHGDRTPVLSSLVLSNDPTKLSELSAPYGYGQLTNIGKQRAYELGQTIKSRYSELISEKYNRSEVFVRTTDSTRTQMTALAELAAIYQPGKNSWSQELQWTPVPYTTVPLKYDFNAAFVNCPVFIDGYQASFYKPVPAMKKFKDVLKVVSKHVSVDLNAYPALTYAVYDLFVSQLSLGLPLVPEIQKVLPKIEEAAGIAMDAVYGNENYVPLQAGVFLNEFFTTVDKVIAGNDTRRFRIYSAHDFNVFSFESVTKITNKQGYPKYASAYSLEVRRNVKNGKYVVLPVYLPEPGAAVKYLKIKGCSQLCDLEKFRQITASNVLDEDTWRSKCGFSNDMYIDDSLV